MFFDLRKKGQLDILVNKAIGCLSELLLEKGDFSEILETEVKNTTRCSEINLRIKEKMSRNYAFYNNGNQQSF